MASVSSKIFSLENQVANLRAGLLAVTPNNLIYAALGSFVKYGCKATEGPDDTDFIISLEGQAAGDSAYLNPDLSLTPTRPFQFPNIASIKAGAFTSLDTTAIVSVAPSTGTARYDIAYIFSGKEGAGFAVAAGTPSAAVKTDFDTFGLSTLDYGIAFDPVIPVGALPIARIYVEDVFTGIQDARIADLRNFLTFAGATVADAFANPPELGSTTPNAVNATQLNLAANSYQNWGATAGAGGYGFRDNNGTIQTKNENGDWYQVGHGGTTGLHGHTGVGDLLFIGTPTSTFSIADGSGCVVDNYTDPLVPATSTIKWTGLTNLAVTDLATTERTYIGINSAGAVIQQPDVWTVEERRDLITIGILVHPDHATVVVADPLAITLWDLDLQIVDFMQAIGPMNVAGNVISANGANLNIDKSAGQQYRLGNNIDNSYKNPSIVTSAADLALTFRYRYQDGSGGITEDSDVTVIDPDLWDDGTGVPAAVNNNKWTVQRVWVFSQGAVRVMYGQNIYSSRAAAEAAIFGAPFNSDPNLLSNASLRGWIIVQEGSTDLSDTGQAKFIEADQFGNTPSGGVSSSTTTLQQAYLNSVIPQITTDVINGALSVRSGTGDDADTVFAIQNNAGGDACTINGHGDVTISNPTPSFSLKETDGTATHNVTRATQSGDFYKLQTRSNADALVSDDYLIEKNSSGAVSHEWRIANAAIASIDSGGLKANNAAGPAMLNEAATTSNPTLIPNRADVDTGLGWVAANQLALIAGGVTGLSASTSQLVSFLTLVAENAAGPAFADEAATGANPTLIPNRTDFDTGIGWNSSNILSVVAGGTENGQFGSAAFNTFGTLSLRGGNTVSLKLGSDFDDVRSITDATVKVARAAIPHYTNAEESAAVFIAQSTSTANLLDIGGGSSSMNAATQVAFKLAANNTTPTGTTVATLDIDGLTVDGDVAVEEFLDLTDPIELTIATGVVTATGSYHLIDTESDAAADDLVTINGNSGGRILILASVVAGRDVTLKDNTGNLRLNGDFVMNNAADKIGLISTGSTWHELFRSSNA